MEPRTPQQLLADVEESVSLVAAPFDEQLRWVDEHNFPVGELTEQLIDVWPLFQRHLSGTGVIDPQDERCLDHLSTYASSMEKRLFSVEAMNEAPEWQKLRELASDALSSLRRPSSEKTEATGTA